MPSSRQLFAALLFTSALPTTMSQPTSTIPTKIVTDSPPTETPSIPTCAKTCFATVTTSLPCASADSSCLCLHASTIESSVQQCLTSSNGCSAEDLTSASNYYATLCLVLGYPTLDKPLSSVPIISASGAPTATPKPHQSNPLPVSTIAGIAAGCALLVATIITLLTFLYMRRRSQPEIIIVEYIDKLATRCSAGNSSASNSSIVAKRQSALFALERAASPDATLRGQSFDTEKGPNLKRRTGISEKSTECSLRTCQNQNHDQRRSDIPTPSSDTQHTCRSSFDGHSSEDDDCETITASISTITDPTTPDPSSTTHKPLPPSPQPAHPVPPAAPLVVQQPFNFDFDIPSPNLGHALSSGELGSTEGSHSESHPVGKPEGNGDGEVVKNNGRKSWI